MRYQLGRSVSHQAHSAATTDLVELYLPLHSRISAIGLFHSSQHITRWQLELFATK